MKYSQNSAFTLIEFLIAITMVAIISVMAFVPYWYYLNKSKVKHTQKEVTQVIYEAKNMALNWRVWENKNISVGVYFDSNNPDEIQVIPFNYSTTLADISNNNLLIDDALSQTEVLSLQLQPGMWFERINWENKWLIYFQAISGSGWVLSWDTFFSTSWEVDIEFAYKKATGWSLRDSITYFTETQIVDY